MDWMRLCLWLILLKNVFAKIRYDNFLLLRCVPETKKHLVFLKSLEKANEVDFWRGPWRYHFPVEFSISPSNIIPLRDRANKVGLNFTTVMHNIQSEFDQQEVKSYIRQRHSTFNWQSYYRLHDIYSWLKDLAALHPSEFQVDSIGKSYENRDIMAVRIKLRHGPHERPIIIIEGGIHAREWISPVFATYLIYHVLNARNLDDDSLLKNVAHEYEWFIIPVTNPDGYEYTHTMDRLWRKNRRPPHGVDLNRNFALHWGGKGSSHISKSRLYRGAHPFSEPESMALKNFVTSHSKNLLYYISLHSYGQYLVIPYGYTTAHLENYKEIAKLTEEALWAFDNIYQTKYTVGNSYETIGYLASGFSTDWVKRNFKVPVALTIELRDQGEYGFALPAELIQPTCEETMAGLLRLFGSKDRLYLRRHHHDGQKMSSLDKFLFFCQIVLLNIFRVLTQ